MTKFSRARRKSLFLTSTILRGRRLRDNNEQGGATSEPDFEVGPGFTQAAEQMGGDDNRSPEQKGIGATQEIPDDDGQQDGNEDGENSGDEAPQDGEAKPKPKRGTAEYIRETKRQLREEKAARIALEQRLAALENGGLPNNQNADKSAPTSEKPDPTDTAKYPLGVLDDGYQADLIDWTAEQKVAAALSKIDQNNKASQAAQLQLQRVAELQTKVDQLAQKGLEQFDDYEEIVVEGGKTGEYELTETTFSAAAEAENGPAILYALANDPAEALRVSQLSPFQQVKYVLDKDQEISGKRPKPRTVPKAGEPPAAAPKGSKASNPIRADTDNLDDFRKIFYQR